MTEQYIIALIGAGAGLFGVAIGSAISWLQARWLSTKDAEKIAAEKASAARYLAVRVVCILDKFMMDCVDVVKDNGLNCGLRTDDGRKEPQVSIPDTPTFPADVDWKSIDHDLMYKILSFPADIEASHRIIDASWAVATGPDYEEGFLERAWWYAHFGLHAHKLTTELCKKYEIKEKTYTNWDPVADLTAELNRLQGARILLRKKQTEFVESIKKKMGVTRLG